jgi:hypothetical protein
VLSYFSGYCFRPFSPLGKPNNRRNLTRPKPLRLTNRKQLPKSKALSPLPSRATRTHPNRTITRTARASGCNRPRRRAQLQKAQQRSAATGATVSAGVAEEPVRIMVGLGVGSISSLRLRSPSLVTWRWFYVSSGPPKYTQFRALINAGGKVREE